MTGAVLDKLDQGTAGLTGRKRCRLLIEDVADRLHDLDVLLLAVAADIVGFSDPASFENFEDRCAVIDDIQPVAHVFAITVDRQILAVQGIVDDQRDQLFRELVGTVVVRAVGDQHRQAVGVVIGADQMVRGGLAGRIG